MFIDSKMNYLPGLYGRAGVENTDQLGRKRNDPVGPVELGCGAQ